MVSLDYYQIPSGLTSPERGVFKASFLTDLLLMARHTHQCGGRWLGGGGGLKKNKRQYLLTGCARIAYEYLFSDIRVK
jgi:hypothetical protein